MGKKREAMDLLNICKATRKNSKLLSEHMPVGNRRQVQLFKYHIMWCDNALVFSWLLYVDKN